MTRRRVCCCGVSTWSKTIAWLHIIGCSLFVAELVYLLYGLTKENPTQFKHLKAEYIYHLENIRREITMEELIFSYVVLIVMILTYVTGVLFSIILLKGSYSRTAKFVRYWIVYACTMTVIAIVTVIAEGIRSNENSILEMVIGAVVTIIFNGFCIWVVRLHLKDIEDDVQLGWPRDEAHA